MEIEFVREMQQQQQQGGDQLNSDKNYVISKLRVFEVPGVEILGDSHSTARLK